MSAVDAPPLLGFPGRPTKSVGQKRTAIRRARRGLIFSSILGTCTLVLATHKLPRPEAEILAIAPFVLVSIQIAAYAIRRATISVIGETLRWGWAAGGVRLSRQRITAIALFGDGLAVTPARGSQWFFAARDWKSFEPVSDALLDAGFPVRRKDGHAPARTRIKGYGFALDVLVVLDCIAAMATFLAALAL